jgi:hypothetical protein
MAELGFEPDARFGTRKERPRPTAPKETKQPALSIHPRRFDLGEVEPAGRERLALQMRNTGNAELRGRVVSHVDWLRAPQKPIRLPADRRAKVMLSVHTDRLPPGKTVEPQALSVETNAGNRQVAFAAEVVQEPLLRVREKTVDFGRVQTRAEQPLTIENAGGETLTAHVISQVPWLQVPDQSFHCGRGSTVQITVQILPDRMPLGPQVQEQALLVDSDAGQASIEVQGEHIAPELALRTEALDLGHLREGETAEHSFAIGNKGTALLRGRVQTSPSWLQAHPERFACPPGNVVEFALTMDSTGLPDGPVRVSRAVRVETNGGTRMLPLHAHVHAPKLLLDTQELTFGSLFTGERKRLHLRLHNDGSALLTAQLEATVDWLDLSQDEITCDPGQGVSVQVTADGSRFAQGQELFICDAIVVSSASDVREIAASVKVLKPALHIEPPRVDFGYVGRSQPETRTVRIKNEGTGDLAWTVQKDAVWLEVSPTSGTCQTGEAQEIELMAYGLALDPDAEAESGTLIINSDAGRTKIPLRAAPASPLISTDITFLNLGTSVNREDLQKSIRIFNHGLGTLRGSISTDQTWLVVDRVSFECPMGRSIEVGVRTDMEEFPSDADRGVGTIGIESNGGYTEVQVEIELHLRPYLEVPEAIGLEQPNGESPPQGRFAIKNSGMATARAHLQADAPEIALTRESYDIKPGKSVRIGMAWQGPLPDEETTPYVHVKTENQEFNIPIVLEDEELDTSDSA